MSGVCTHIDAPLNPGCAKPHGAGVLVPPTGKTSPIGRQPVGLPLVEGFGHPHLEQLPHQRLRERLVDREVQGSLGRGVCRRLFGQLGITDPLCGR